MFVPPHSCIPSTRPGGVRSGLRLGWALSLLVGCNNPPPDAALEAPLFARAEVLWPVADHVATVRVCWLPLELGGESFPAPAFAPDLATILPVRKAWAQAIVASQWNALTPLQFVGWNDCDGSAVDVKLRPISSAYKATGCGSSGSGQSCAEGLGTDLRNGGAANLNLLFGDEVRYSSRYGQSVVGRAYDASLDLAYWWLPTPCLNDFKRPWVTNSTVSTHPVNINDPAVATMFDDIYQSCLQYNVLHEFGHVAGFAHEQYRTDDTQKQADCYALEASLGIADDLPAQVATRYRGTKTLGPFDSESIMSYCRREPAATLSDEDVAMTISAYGGTPPTGAGGVVGNGGHGGGSGGGGGAMGGMTSTGGTGPSAGGAGGTQSTSGTGGATVHQDAGASSPDATGMDQNEVGPPSEGKTAGNGGGGCSFAPSPARGPGERNREGLGGAVLAVLSLLSRWRGLTRRDRPHRRDDPRRARLESAKTRTRFSRSTIRHASSRSSILHVVLFSRLSPRRNGM